MSYQDELTDLAKKYGGMLKPEYVVAFAKNPKTDLHNYFEWDDGEAAEKYRLWQARRIIKVCVNVVPGSSKKHQVFVSLKDDREDGGGYRMLVDVMSDERMREQLLKQSFKEFAYWREKYDSLEELVPVFESMDKVVRKNAKKKK
jgi:hypothetical protein